MYHDLQRRFFDRFGRLDAWLQMKHLGKMRELLDWRNGQCEEMFGDRMNVSVKNGSVEDMFRGLHE